jgi:hypothetical protein
MNRATWGPGNVDALCWSCREGVAIARGGGYRPWYGHRNRTTRHPVADIPWYGPSPKARRRAVGRSTRREPVAKFLQSFLRMQLPVVVTCSCGADNLVEIPGPSE